jgi:phosphatidylserine decarboxylase
MTIHREGYKTIALTILSAAVINFIMLWFFSSCAIILCLFILAVTLAITFLVVYFFRIPGRELTIDDGCIIAPADGKVVVVEEVFDEEYFKAKRLQISIFMSPLNVHVNRNPVSGEVLYSTYHPGKYLVAWHPKSSTDNERHSVVLRRGNDEILVKQIAGALARRIVNYLEVGSRVAQGEEMGFIKFGSRVDVLLPPGTKVNVAVNERVKGGVTILARW